MKTMNLKLILSIVLLGLISFPFMANGQDIEEGLVAYYPLDGDGVSGLEGGPEAIVEGVPAATEGFNSVENGAMMFGAEGDAMSADDSQIGGLPVENEARSVALWVKFNSGMTNNIVMVNYGTPDPLKGAHVHFTYRPNEGGGRVRIGHWYADYDFDGLDLKDDTWHHLAYSYDGEEFIFYLDGVETGYAPVSSSLEPVFTVLNGDFVIGARNTELREDHMQGAIDELRVYNLAISADVVSAIYAYDPQYATIEKAVVNNIEVFPNPVQDILNIKTDEVIQNVQIMNLSGQTVYECAKDEIDVSGFSPNVYFVKVLTPSGSKCSKILVR